MVATLFDFNDVLVDDEAVHLAVARLVDAKKPVHMERLLAAGALDG